MPRIQLALRVADLEGSAEAPTRLDHLGVEENTTCCYAVQDKVWVTGPGDERWEVYTVLADARPDLEGQKSASEERDEQTACSCEAPAPEGRTGLAVTSAGKCC